MPTATEALVVASRRASEASLTRRYPEAVLLDVTSRGPQPWVRFSPFYPHGDIPVPASPGVYGQSVEGIWQALKVFERADVDLAKLDVTSMKGLKRSSRSFGRVLGHREGIDGTDGRRLLPYIEARRAIYLPAYRWVLEHRVQDLVGKLRDMSRGQPVVLLDYETNEDVDDPRRPLSHAALIKAYVMDRWPA